MKKATKKAALLILICTLAFTAFFCISCKQDEEYVGEKTITVTVIDNTEKENIFEITTEATRLADALLEEEIISQKNDDGLYLTFCGITADYNTDQGWWKVCKGSRNSMINEGINDLGIADGDVFFIIYTIGF